MISGSTTILAAVALLASPVVHGLPARDSSKPNPVVPSLFNIRYTDAPTEYQCLQVMAPPGGIWTLWSECKDKDPRGPEALWKLVPNGDTVLIQEQHFNDLEPGVSPQCLLNTKPYRPDRDALVQLGDCDAKAANQQWKVQFDSAGKPQIIGTYGKYKGQCLVQTQDPAYKQESVGDYSGVFNYLPCGDKTKAKGAITPPATALELVDATDAKFVPAFETIQQDKLGKYEDPVPPGAFKLLVQGNPSDDRCIGWDANDGTTLFAAVCISRYDDSPLAIWKTATTKQGNVQFRELHGSDDYCLTYFDKDVYVDGDVLVASAGVQTFECKPDALYQQWTFNEKDGLIKSADPRFKNQCVSFDPKAEYGTAFIMASCDKASRFSKYTKYMHLDNYVEE